MQKIDSNKTTNLHFVNMLMNDTQFHLHAAHIYKSLEIERRNVIVLFDEGKFLQYSEQNPFGREALRKYNYELILKLKKEFENCSVRFISLDEINKKMVQEKNSLRSKTVNNLLLNASKSAIASHTRSSNVELTSNKWQLAVRNLYSDYQKMYGLLCFFLQMRSDIKKIVSFNGRYPSSKAANLAAQKSGKSYVNFDLNKGHNHYEAENDSLHSIDLISKRAKTLFYKDSKKATLTAKKFYNDKIAGRFTVEKSYTKVQSLSVETLGVKKDKYIAVFTSSDDEYRYLGAEWGGTSKLANQFDEIKHLINIVPKEQNIVVRIHPNQYYTSNLELKKLRSITKKKNVFLVEARSKVKSYDILLNSQLVISFSSSIGPEASFWGKNLITIGPSPFVKLNIGNNVDTLKKFKELPTFKFNKNKLGSEMWANYLINWKDPLPAFKIDKNDKISVKNRNLFHRSMNFSVILSKIEIKVAKGNLLDYQFYKDQILRFIGILKNETIGEHQIDGRDQ